MKAYKRTCKMLIAAHEAVQLARKLRRPDWIQRALNRRADLLMQVQAIARSAERRFKNAECARRDSNRTGIMRSEATAQYNRTRPEFLYTQKIFKSIQTLIRLEA